MLQLRITSDVVCLGAEWVFITAPASLIQAGTSEDQSAAWGSEKSLQSITKPDNDGFFTRLATSFFVLGAPVSILPRSYVPNEDILHLLPPVSLPLTLRVL